MDAKEHIQQVSLVDRLRQLLYHAKTAYHRNSPVLITYANVITLEDAIDFVEVVEGRCSGEGSEYP